MQAHENARAKNKRRTKKEDEGEKEVFRQALKSWNYWFWKTSIPRGSSCHS